MKNRPTPFASISVAAALLAISGCASATGAFRPDGFVPEHGAAVVRFEPPAGTGRTWLRSKLSCVVEVHSREGMRLLLEVEEVTSGRPLELNPGGYTIFVSQCRLLCRAAWQFDGLRLMAKQGHEYRVAVIDAISTMEGAWMEIALYDVLAREVVSTVAKDECILAPHGL